VAAVVAGLAGAWVAAGSTGLLAHALRHVLTWLAVATALMCGWSGWGRAPRRVVLTFCIAVLVLVGTCRGTSPAVSVMAVAVALALLAAGRAGAEERVLACAAAAVGVLGVYRFANQCIPAFWLLTDAAGGIITRAASMLMREPLRTGATFAGLDYLVVMGVLVALWVLDHSRRRSLRGAIGTLAVGGAHLAYLGLLAHSPRLLSLLPAPPAEPPSFGHLPPWSWSGVVRLAIPWNVPAAAGLVHLVLAGVIVRRWARRPTVPEQSSRRLTFAVLAGIGILAAVLPVVATLAGKTAGLKGRKVVVFEKGFLNWLKPEHGDYGRLSVGMYGLLPRYIESLGGRCVISPELSEDDLSDADVLILLYPNEPWAPGQLDRIHNFVRRGGSLLVMGEHTVREADGGARFNDVLEPTAMRVAFDSATFAVGGWLQSYDALAHPATAGVADDRNQFGVVIGASLNVRWPARPILVGRWGWSDPGDPTNEPSLMGNHAYDAGERLGDLILAAEQRMGAGRIIAFGDTSSLTNGITPGSYVFTSRLLGYLAGGMPAPQTALRMTVAIAGSLVLTAATLRRPRTSRVIVLGLVLSTSWVLCEAANEHRGRVLPDGRGHTPNNLAYIDASHLEAYSDESWRPDGIAGLMMTLMRSGYLALSLPELTSERIERAGIVISIAPSRGFTRSERKALRRFVENGGILICMVGCEEPQRTGLLPVLEDYGFFLGEQPPDAYGRRREATPLGHFKSPYYDAGDYMVYVRFHAAWPVVSTASDARVMAYGRGDTTVMLMRRVGRGRVVLVGDTCFAMNKNLEREGGEPFEGMRENAHFWRWALTYWTDQPMWVPPNPQAPPTALSQPAPTAAAESREAGGEEPPP